MQPQGPSPEELRRQKEEEERKKRKEGIARIKNLCRSYRNNHNASDYTISNKLIDELLVIDRSDVFLGQDATLFKSGKSGFAITANGVHCIKKGMNNPIITSYISLAEASELSSPKGTSDIYLDGKLLACTSGCDLDDLINLFSEISYIAMAMYDIVPADLRF